MRHIMKQTDHPEEMIEWQEENIHCVNNCYGHIPSTVRAKIKEQLIAEQGGICAYTGMRIDAHTSHIEHLQPQTHCRNGEDVAYQNMVACSPGPGQQDPPYGAKQKGQWPDPSNAYLFVSPLSPGCEARFNFDMRGKITPAGSGHQDAAVAETIKRLGLDHSQLTELRNKAIRATLATRERGPGSLPLADARKRLQSLRQDEETQGTLEPFCFVLKQALEKHLTRSARVRAQMATERM
jgi:uncharacterized protein (TIGR02646 family)